MSKVDSFETSLLQLLLNNSNIANVGDATGLRGSTVAGSLYVSLHTADPLDAGSQVTSEITYTSYARVALARSAAGFTISGNAAQFTSQVNFPPGTGGSGTATHWGLGVASAGAGVLLYKGTITPNIICGNGITPQLAAGTNVITED